MDAAKILVANPCDAERELLKHALQANGLEVLCATCAKEASETAQTQTPQLILLDNLNWEAPALTTLSALRQHPRTSRIPVVIFGNPRNKEEVTEAVNKGAALWMGRQGFEVGRFVERLRGVIKAGANQPGSAEAAASEAGEPTLSERIDAAGLNEMLAESGPLPAFEFNVVDAVTTTCAKEQAIQHISGIVSRDPLLAVTVLSAANCGEGQSSTKYAHAGKAVAELGAKAFYQLVESVPPLRLNLASIWDPGYFWAHSVATARIAGTLSKALQLAAPGAAVTAGLLHDLGYFVLAHFWPKHYGALFSAGLRMDSISPLWEKNLIGAHHGELGAWAMEHYGLPAVLYDSANVHHAGGMVGQALAPMSRLIAMVVQAADCLAAALFPADPPLMTLCNPVEEFESALEENGVSAQFVADQSRKIVAELLTEMPYLFPQSSARSFFYRREPLDRVAYYAPGAGPLDVFRLFLEVRCRELGNLDNRTVRSAPAEVPMVVNLSHVRATTAQIEILTSLMDARIPEDRPGVVLVPAALPDRAVQSLILPGWRLVPMPAHSGRWIRLLSPHMADEFESQACVA